MDDLLVRNETAARNGAVLVNARIVLDGEVMRDDLAIAGGQIVAGAVAGTAEVDFDGDYLIPGLTDLHTDNIEHHFHPRPGPCNDASFEDGRSTKLLLPSSQAGLLKHALRHRQRPIPRTDKTKLLGALEPIHHQAPRPSE